MQGVIATMAVLASPALAQVGKAIVSNQCQYDVHLTEVPAQGGGYETTEEILSAGDTWDTTWHELSNGAGWSIKLSKNTDLSHILQYEYTFQNDGVIWYDLSQVNGNPWDGDWMITATSESSTCSPKQVAYRYATDDAYGMQACPSDAEITVTLCSGEEQNDGIVASVSSSQAAESSSDVATGASTFSTPASTPASSEVGVSTTPASSVPASSTPTTFQTAASTTPASSTFATTSSVVTTDGAGATVTEVNTAVETEVVTQTHWWDNHGGHRWGRRHGHGHA